MTTKRHRHLLEVMDGRSVAFCSPDPRVFRGCVFDVWRRRSALTNLVTYELVAIVGDEKTALRLTQSDAEGSRYVWEPRRP